MTANQNLLRDSLLDQVSQLQERINEPNQHAPEEMSLWTYLKDSLDALVVAEDVPEDIDTLSFYYGLLVMCYWLLPEMKDLGKAMPDSKYAYQGLLTILVSWTTLILGKKVETVIRRELQDDVDTES